MEPSNLGDDWTALTSEDINDEDEIQSSGSSKVVVDMNDEPVAHYMTRRDSVESVEVMSISNSEEDEDHDSTCSKQLMTCSTCSNIFMNQSMTGSMVHVKMEDIDTQTEVVEDDQPPKEIRVTDESALAVFCQNVVNQLFGDCKHLFLIGSHVFFAAFVLGLAYLSGFLSTETVNGLSPMTSSRQELLITGQQRQVTASIGTVTTGGNRELQSPDWLQQLSTLLDDVSTQLTSIDGQVAIVERQSNDWDADVAAKGANVAKQQQVVDAYRHLLDKQRQAARLLDKINSVLNYDRAQPRSSQYLLDIRLKLVDVAADFVALNSRLIEVTLANKRRHVNAAKKASGERHRIETQMMESVLDRIRKGDTAAPAVDVKSLACRRMLRPRHEPDNSRDIADLAECMIRSRQLAQQAMNEADVCRREVSTSARHVADLRFETQYLLNRTGLLLRQRQQLYDETQLLKSEVTRSKVIVEKPVQKPVEVPSNVSLLQCFSKWLVFRLFFMKLKILIVVLFSLQFRCTADY